MCTGAGAGLLSALAASRHRRVATWSLPCEPPSQPTRGTTAACTQPAPFFSFSNIWQYMGSMGDQTQAEINCALV